VTPVKERLQHLTSSPVGGPDRPPSKRMIEQMKHEDQERRQALREGRAAPPPEQSGSQEGYWSYMSRQVQERTERLGIVGDSMDRLEENSSNFANDVGKYVQSQKRKAVFGGKSISDGARGPECSPPCMIDADRSSCSTWFEVWALVCPPSGFNVWLVCIQYGYVLFVSCFSTAQGWLGQYSWDVIDHFFIILTWVYMVHLLLLYTRPELARAGCCALQ
jgi:hypothetical protein